MKSKKLLSLLKGIRKVIFFTGPPLAGKDTQAKLLAKRSKGKFIISHVVIDRFLKNQKSRYLKIGKKIFNLNKEKEKRFQGGFYSPELVGYIISEKIKKEFLQLPENKNKILIFSGSPRLISEAKIEIKTLKELKIDFIVFSLILSEEEILKRAVKRGRDIEDKKEIVQKRIENYKKYVLPTINFLKKQTKVFEIKSEGSVTKIHKEIYSLFKKNL